MADNDKQVAVNFTDQFIRPMAEKLQDIKVFADAAKVQWLKNVAPIWAGHAGPDKLVDGSPDDGRTTVTKQDHDDVIALVNSIITSLGAADKPELLSKFAGRPPRFFR